MSKTYHPETEVKRDLTEAIREAFPKYLVFRIENSVSNAIPDIVVTGNKVSSWIEVKYAKPDFGSKGDQELMMLRLARQGFAWYVIYYEVENEKRTYIVDPRDIGKPIEEWKRFAEGFNHQFVVSLIRGIHEHHFTDSQS
jgi:Holliday junction resolvase